MSKRQVEADQAACPLVAIGASAGGVEALRTLFKAMPANPGIAFVVVLHLSPSHESQLVGVLQRVTSLEVVPCREGAELKRDCIYVIPPAAMVRINGKRLSVAEPSSDFERRHPVDALFQSVAEQRKADAVCIVLSGSGSNGSAGAQHVRMVDGIVIAQDPATAEHAEMPRNIIVAGLADQVLAPEDIPAVLIGITRRSRTLVGGRAPLQSADSGHFNEILSILRVRGRHNFTPYKTTTIVRRILRRMGLNQIGTLEDYARKLDGSPGEVDALVADLLINVTSFFRDAEAWRFLESEVVAPLVDSRQAGDSIRAWTTACSTGEEAYSLAMALLQRIEDMDKQIDLKVFATDPAHQALARARAGVFADSIAETIPRERLERFFDKEDSHYRAKKSLREAVIFAPQNLLADPPFSRLDVVTCRNLLIYLEPEVQKRVIGLLHFALREGGHLFLGSAESVGDTSSLFEPVSKKWRIYRRLGSTRHDLVDFPLLGIEHRRRIEGEAPEPAQRRAPSDEARDALVGFFAPPSVLIDDRQRVLYLHGDLAPFLRPPRGEPTYDLLPLVRDDLRSRLRAAVRQALQEGIVVSGEQPVRVGEDAGAVRITVAPVPSTGMRRLLVTFQSRQPAASTVQPRALVAANDQEPGSLEEELRAAREELRLSVEQLEASNEELKASNEEITSMNEELQSTNEELETSKEELQSLNEELNTVNAQLQGKVEELEDRSNDLRNLLNSTAIATLFLDRHQRIRWFSPPVRALFQVIPADIGRSIRDLSQRFDDDGFLEDAEEVLQSLTPREKEVRGHDGRWHLRRILPYRTEDNRIDGTVATFTDITDRRRWEHELEAAKTYAELIVDTIRQPLVVLDAGLRVESVNRAFRVQFDLGDEEVVAGRPFFELSAGDWNIPALRAALTPIKDGDPGLAISDLEITHDFAKLGRRHMLVNVRRLDDMPLMLVAIEDITGRRVAERHKELLVSELQHRVKNLIAKITAVISASAGSSGVSREYVKDIRGRLEAMARTEQLIGGNVEGTPLAVLVEAEVRIFRGDRRVDIGGPPLLLNSEAAQSVALMLHELVTNAAKYGAFSKSGGKLKISWTVIEDNPPRMLLQWTESGVSVAPATDSRGFGWRLISEVPRSLGGDSHLDLQPDGLRCTFDIPMSDRIFPAPEKVAGSP